MIYNENMNIKKRLPKDRRFHVTYSERILKKMFWKVQHQKDDTEILKNEN